MELSVTYFKDGKPTLHNIELRNVNPTPVIGEFFRIFVAHPVQNLFVIFQTEKRLARLVDNASMTPTLIPNEDCILKVLFPLFRWKAETDYLLSSGLLTQSLDSQGWGLDGKAVQVSHAAGKTQFP